MNITLKKLGSSRVQATIVLDDARVQTLSDQAINELGSDIKLKGFRPGKAPKELLREHITTEKIHEKVIQKEMPAIMQELVGTHSIKPIIRPRVELHALTPMTLIITLVEKPEAKVARKKIKLSNADLHVEKKELKGKNEEKESKEFNELKDKKGEKELKETKEKTPEEKKQVEDNAILELIAVHTTIDLAPELVSDEAEQLIEEHARRMAQFGIKFEDWLAAQKKSIVDLIKEMQPDAEKRLKIRFGITALLDDLAIDVSDSEMQEAIDALLAPLKGVEHDELTLLYKQGERAYEQFKFQKRVQKLLEKLRST